MNAADAVFTPDVAHRWTPLPFSKRHPGKTLPHIAFVDPEFLFWAFEHVDFADHGMAAEARRCHLRARRIRIPQAGVELLVAEYVCDHAGAFCSLDIVPMSRQAHPRSLRLPWIDLGVARLLRGGMDRAGGKMLAQQVRFFLFGVECRRLTAKACDRFFDDGANFVLDGDAVTP